MFIKNLIAYHKKKKNALRTHNADVQSMPQYDTRKQILKKIYSWKTILFSASITLLTTICVIFFIKPLISALPLYPVFLVGGLVIYGINFLGMMYALTDLKITVKNIEHQSQELLALHIKQGKKDILLFFMHFFFVSVALFSTSIPFFPLIFAVSIPIGGKIIDNYLLPKAEAGTLPTWIYRWLGRTKPSISDIMHQSIDDDIPQLENRSS